MTTLQDADSTSCDRRRCRPCWIKPDGEMIPCPNWNDHLHIASLEFPDAAQPEGAAVDSGWLKVFRVDESFCFLGKSLTLQQRETVERLFHIAADEVDDEAKQFRRVWSQNGRCVA